MPFLSAVPDESEEENVILRHYNTTLRDFGPKLLTTLEQNNGQV